MRRRTRRTLKKTLKIVAMLILLGTLAFALPYLWFVASSSLDSPREPKSENYAKD